MMTIVVATLVVIHNRQEADISHLWAERCTGEVRVRCAPYLWRHQFVFCFDICIAVGVAAAVIVCLVIVVIVLVIELLFWSFVLFF